MGIIIQGSKYGNPRKQAASAQISDKEMDRRREAMQKFQPMLAGRGGRPIKLRGQIPGTMNMDNAMTTQTPGTGGRGSMITSSPIYYDPRFYTLDRFYFPRTREQAYSIWKIFYDRDPACGVGVDLFSDLPWSEFDILGIEDPRVKQFYEDMFSDLNLPSILPQMTNEYLKMGVVVPHLVLDGRSGYWNTVFAHNPNYIRVTAIPIPGAEPLLDLKPSPELRDFAVSRDPRVMAMRTMLPSVFVQRLMAGMPIPLDPINATYLARRSSPYDLEGVSIYSRVYRINMIEDFLTNATIAVTQRNAAPIRLFKLGDRDTGWLPEKEDEEALAEMLAACETDPMGVIIYHYGIDVEYVGVSDKAYMLGRDWDMIERIKFLAMGINKSFLLGETSFAAAVAGLQTMAERLLALREKFENLWIYPKVIRNVAKMNQMYRRKACELSHRIRTTAHIDSNLIVPKIKWRKTLEATQDTSLLRIWQEVRDSGICSDRTLATGSGLDLDTERKNLIEEAEYKQKLSKDHPEMMQQAASLVKRARQKGMLPPADKTNGRHRYHAPSYILGSKIWDREGKYAGIDYRDVEPIVELLRDGSTEDREWENIKAEWGPIGAELDRRGYSEEQIERVADILREEGINSGKQEIEEMLTGFEAKMKAEVGRHERGLSGKKFLSGHDPAGPVRGKEVESN